MESNEFKFLATIENRKIYFQQGKTRRHYRIESAYGDGDAVKGSFKYWSFSHDRLLKESQNKYWSSGYHPDVQVACDILAKFIFEDPSISPNSK